MWMLAPLCFWAFSHPTSCHPDSASLRFPTRFVLFHPRFVLFSCQGSWLLMLCPSQRQICWPAEPTSSVPGSVLWTPIPDLPVPYLQKWLMILRRMARYNNGCPGVTLASFRGDCAKEWATKALYVADDEQWNAGLCWKPVCHVAPVTPDHPSWVLAVKIQPLLCIFTHPPRYLENTPSQCLACSHEMRKDTYNCLLVDLLKKFHSKQPLPCSTALH